MEQSHKSHTLARHPCRQKIAIHNRYCPLSGTVNRIMIQITRSGHDRGKLHIFRQSDYYPTKIGIYPDLIMSKMMYTDSLIY